MAITVTACNHSPSSWKYTFFHSKEWWPGSQWPTSRPVWLGPKFKSESYDCLCHCGLLGHFRRGFVPMSFVSVIVFSVTLYVSVLNCPLVSNVCCFSFVFIFVLFCFTYCFVSFLLFSPPAPTYLVSPEFIHSFNNYDTLIANSSPLVGLSLCIHTLCKLEKSHLKLLCRSQTFSCSKYVRLYADKKQSWVSWVPDREKGA